MRCLQVLEGAISDAEKLRDRFPLPIGFRRETYESVPHLLLAYSIMQKLHGDYHRVRIESHCKPNKELRKVDVDVGEKYDSVELLVEVKPLWGWKRRQRDWLSRKVIQDVKKLKKITDDPSLWEGNARPVCAAVVAPLVRPRKPYLRYKEVRELRNYCEKNSVHLCFLRMFPRRTGQTKLSP